MNDLIQDELEQVLRAWRSGMTVPSIVLGHSVREVEVNGQRTHEIHVFRQKKAYELVFALIETSLPDAPRIDFDYFDAVAQEKAAALGLSAEERAAAVSLAWVALRRGWGRALSGFPDAHAISLKKETEA